MRQTSIEAYQALITEGVLPTRRAEVYDWLYFNGPATAAEVEDGVCSKDAHKRLPELRNLGVVCEVGKRKCSLTGRNVIEWDVTNQALKND